MLPGGDKVLPGGDQVLPGVTSCDQVKCFGITGDAKTMFWHDRSCKTVFWRDGISVLALRELKKQRFGMTGVPEIVFLCTGVAKTVFWHDGSCKNSVLA